MFWNLLHEKLYEIVGLPCVDRESFGIYNVHVPFAPLKQECLTSTRDLGMVFVYVFVSFDFSGMMMESAMLCKMALCCSQQSAMHHHASSRCCEMKSFADGPAYSLDSFQAPWFSLRF